MEPIRGTAAGVPYLALPPENGAEPAPMVAVWHLMDAPRTEAAMAAALPLSSVSAWRVYLGLPLVGERMPAGGREQLFAWAREDTLLKFLGVAITQAADEFPAALAELRARLPVAEGPVYVVGGSAGGGAALLALADHPDLIAGAVAINAAIRATSFIALTEAFTGVSYKWSDESRKVAERLDFVARAAEFSGRSLLLVSGEADHPDFQADATALQLATDAQLAKVPGLAHPLAEEPGLEAAEQSPGAKAVDALVSDWLNGRRLGDAGRL
jgi:hypothetical protein